MGSWGTSRMVTGDSEIFRLDNLESKVVVHALLLTDVDAII